MRDFYLILPTKYNSIEDSRFKLLKKTIRNASNHSYITKVIVVDSSHDKVYNYLKELDSKIILLDQKDKTMLKGGSIREGIKYVVDNFTKDSVICFQEPEKENMIYHYRNILEKYNIIKSFICVTQRTRSSFDTYPIEQVYSENFMNKYISKLANKTLDWSAGPVLFTSDKADYWLNFNGKLWDAQIIPLVEAIKSDEVILKSVVCFQYPPEQKKKEEGNLFFIEKRRYQLNYMVDSVIEYLKIN